jgi:hypothetical protein
MAAVRRHLTAELTTPLALLLMLVTFSGCGYQDWEAKLPGGYTVGTAGDSRVMLRHGDGPLDTVAETESIAAYGNDARWIQLRLSRQTAGGKLGGGPIDKPYVLLDTSSGTAQRTATEAELQLALPPDVPALVWLQAANPNTPRFVYVLWAGVAAAAICFAALILFVAAALKKRRARV